MYPNSYIEVEKYLGSRNLYHPAVDEDEGGREGGQAQASVDRELRPAGRNDGHRVDEEHDGEDDERADVDGVHDQPRHQEPSSAASTPEIYMN